jgi:hypothetical protein
VAFAAILIRQDVFAVLQGRPLWRCIDDVGNDRFSGRQHAGTQHDDA